MASERFYAQPQVLGGEGIGGVHRHCAFESRAGLVHTARFMSGPPGFVDVLLLLAQVPGEPGLQGASSLRSRSGCFSAE
ncbi:MAG: hypothetical protein HY897_23315 [Deltaproteobacteria bacterium]|nr:hypothetical protein [Deltaproteobacteria bacterium]